MTVTAIHQPCYFPWLGLLHKIAACDELIILDEVQLSDSAYQHRNQFLTNDGKVKYLTIPFAKRNYLEVPFKDLQVADQAWGAKHEAFISNNYRRHPFYTEVFPVIQPLFREPGPGLLAPVLESMRLSMKLLNANPRVVLQSEVAYDRSARKGELVLELLKATGANHYLSGRGAEQYQDDAAFAAVGIRLEYAHFAHPVYPQVGGREFIPGLSCLDLLFNVGSQAGARLLAGGATQ